jgi:hypothetical protein
LGKFGVFVDEESGSTNGLIVFGLFVFLAVAPGIFFEAEGLGSAVASVADCAGSSGATGGSK